jgi:hypothetical protein
MDDVIFLLALTAQVAVDHLTDRCGPVFLCNSAPAIRIYHYETCAVQHFSYHDSTRTREPHMPHLDTIVSQVLDKLLALCRLACAIETFKDYELASCHS